MDPRITYCPVGNGDCSPITLSDNTQIVIDRNTTSGGAAIETDEGVLTSQLRRRQGRRSTSGAIISGQPPMVVDHADHVWWSIAPTPENCVDVAGHGTRGKARHQNASDAVSDEARGHAPGRRHEPFGGKILPGARQVGGLHAEPHPFRRVGEIHDISTVGLICADRHWLCLECEALLSLEPGGFDPQRGVERLGPLRIETTAEQRRTLPGLRREGPSRVQSPIDGNRQPQA